jgi:hypothetical protein
MKTPRSFPKINLAPLLLRDVEDLASQAKAYESKNGEGLFARATVIIAVIALDHFVDLYLDRISPDSKKREIKSEIERLRKDRKIGTAVGAKWYAVISHYTLSRFPTDLPPFSDLTKLVKLRNRLVHLYQKNVQSRTREGVPNLLREVNWRTAETACQTVREMISAFYQEAGQAPPAWLVNR